MSSEPENNTQNNSHNNIFPTVPSVSSRSSVHFVPGNRFWIERKLQQRNRRQDEQKRISQENEKYFAKITAENKLYENWEKHHPLVKQFENSSTQDHIAHNFMDPSNIDKIGQEIRQECTIKLTNLLKVYNDSKIAYEKHTNGIDPINALKFLFEFKKFFQEIENHRMNNFNEIHHNFYELPYNSSHDPLRRVCFLINNLLSFNKDSIFSLLKLLRNVRTFLEEHEQKELNQLNNRCFQIMDMYLQMNELRNKHFSPMYSEEKEELWDEQITVWKSEIDIWDSLMCKLLQTNYQVVFDKVKKYFIDCDVLFKKRLQSFNDLQIYFIEIDNNSFLKTVLQKDISYFKI